jgi:hypothetical protein
MRSIGPCSTSSPTWDDAEMPVRFWTIDAGPDRARALAVASALRRAGIRVETVTDTTVLIRAEDRARAELVIDELGTGT